jgi:hypothetical protein
MNKHILRELVARIRTDFNEPRVHPSGFIQLDLSRDASMRLHVWPDEMRSEGEIPCQTTKTPIHDHKFDMESMVICGSLKQTIYNADLDGFPTHEIYIADYGLKPASVNTILRPTGVRVAVGTRDTEWIEEGRTYYQSYRTFHSSDNYGLTATLMMKADIYQEPARVLCRIGETPDNDFDRLEVDQDVLWAYIDAALCE